MSRTILFAAAFLAVTATFACNAQVETGCVGGECATPGAGGASSSTTSTASQGGGGAGGGGPACLACLPDTGMQTGALPCDVATVLFDKCQRCHTEPQKSGAPFALLTYADTQALYGVQPIYAAMEHQVRLGTMPLNPPKLVPDEKKILLDWLCACAPPAPAGTTCP